MPTRQEQRLIKACKNGQYNKAKRQFNRPWWRLLDPTWKALDPNAIMFGGSFSHKDQIYKPYYTPLQVTLTSEQPDPEIIRLLLSLGADPAEKVASQYQVPKRGDSSALAYAASKNKIAHIRALFEQADELGIKLKQLEADGSPSLFKHMLDEFNLEILQILLEHADQQELAEYSKLKHWMQVFLYSKIADNDERESGLELFSRYLSYQAGEDLDKALFLATVKAKDAIADKSELLPFRRKCILWLLKQGANPNYNLNNDTTNPEQLSTFFYLLANKISLPGVTTAMLAAADLTWLTPNNESIFHVLATENKTLIDLVWIEIHRKGVVVEKMLNTQDNNLKMTALHIAIKAKNQSLFDLLWHYHPEMYLLDSKGNLALHYACETENNYYFDQLFEANTPIEYKNKDLQTPLHVTCARGDDYKVEKLLQRNAPMDSKNKQGDMSLHLAIASGSLATVQLLLAKGCKLNAVNNHQFSAVYIACKVSYEMLQLLLDAKAPTQLADKNGDTALHLACRAGDFRKAAALLAAGANPKAKNRIKKTPIDEIEQASQYSHDRQAIAELMKLDKKALIISAAKQQLAEQLNPQPSAPYAEASTRPISGLFPAVPAQMIKDAGYDNPEFEDLIAAINNSIDAG